jgi:hypothetical protein
MVKIIDKRTEPSAPTYKIGDWIYFYEHQTPYLCVFAQTDKGIGQLIAIDSTTANRLGNSVGELKFEINEDNGRIDCLSEKTINHITVNGKHKIEKVNITIEITNYNS